MITLEYSVFHTINLTVIADLSVKYHDCNWLSIFARIQSILSSSYVVPFHHTKLSALLNIKPEDIEYLGQGSEGLKNMYK